jgi:hypothetical protein
MDQTFAVFVRFRIHDVDGQWTYVVEPARKSDAAMKLGCLNLRLPGVQMKATICDSLECQVNLGVGTALEYGGGELTDV